MKFFYFLSFAIIASLSLHAQPIVAKDSSEIVTIHTDTSGAKVEYESEFPGGQAAWVRFLNANLTYPDKAIRKKVQGTVVVQFIVDKDGFLSDIQAISGPELLRATAVKIFENSPRWKPAFQNGRKVKSYKKQPIAFRLQ